MIDVKLEHFELYRSNLLRYAVGLLKSRGSANTLYAEYEEKAKDIVQDCYLVFHKHSQDAFVSEFHLFNFLKSCLYKCYQVSVHPSRRLAQYSLFKDLVDVKSDKVTRLITTEIQLDDTMKFLETLTDNQRQLMNRLLDGFSYADISKEDNVSRQAIQSRIEHIRKKYKEYESKGN